MERSDLIYPQNNSFRQYQDLSGFWDFCLDPKDRGFSEGWPEGIPNDRRVAVPASWNEQFQDTRDYLGPAWYQTRFDLPWGFRNKNLALRFGSVNYMAQVWLNGVKLGEHEGGHLPFLLEATQNLKPKDNLLVVRVEGLLAPDRVPPGNVPPDPKDRFNNFFNPPASFDFFPFCGIHRPVLLVATPQECIQDITVKTDIVGKTGKVSVDLVTGFSP
ncbi:MAG TPA: beta galactosidase jelly roll domain-containing protein, partial [Puia sp.]|nr:beta galactosidase jelly roll domain-containing protein [Puia sp.]